MKRTNYFVYFGIFQCCLARIFLFKKAQDKIFNDYCPWFPTIFRAIKKVLYIFQWPVESVPMFIFQFNFCCFVIFCQVFCVLLYICFYLILIFAFFLNMTIALFKKTCLWFKVAPNCLPNRTPSVSRILHPQFSYLYLQLSSPCVQCIYFISFY